MHPIEKWFVVATLILSILVSIADNISIINIPLTWQLPVMFFVVLAIFRLVLPIDRLVDQVQRLVDIQSSIQCRNYPASNDFYSGLQQAVRSAQTNLKLSYIRRSPPNTFSDSQQARLYFDSVLQWARSGRGTVQRIICIPDEKSNVSSTMLDWAKEEDALSNNIPEYNIRFVPWSIDADAINLAIIDGKTVFIAISGYGEQEMKGISLRDGPGLAYFSEYYDQLWTQAQNLSDFLEQRGTEI